ncbi:MAG: hypothetical protein ACUVT8_01800 [Armatimonadota bacterium]
MARLFMISTLVLTVLLSWITCCEQPVAAQSITSNSRVAQTTTDSEEKESTEREARREAEERKTAIESGNTKPTPSSQTNTVINNPGSSEKSQAKENIGDKPAITQPVHLLPTERNIGENDNAAHKSSELNKLKLEIEKRRLVELEQMWRNRWTRYRPIAWSDYYFPGARGWEYIPVFTAVITKALDPAKTTSLQLSSRSSDTLEIATPETTGSHHEVHSYYDRYPTRPIPRSYVGIVVAPGSSGRKTSIGLQYLSNTGYGIGLWFAGTFGLDSDIIEATIPHDDYHTITRWSSYSVQALCGIGSESAILTFGAGVSVEKTTYVDVSNVTGWKWYGGETTVLKPCAVVGCQLSLSERVSIQLGYDTSRRAFFGLCTGF